MCMALHTEEGVMPLRASRAKLGELSLKSLSVQLFPVSQILYSDHTFVVKKN